MDSITQIVLGAAAGEAVAGKKLGNKAIFWGAVAGTIPDLDILAYPWLTEVQKLAFHRGISHSLFFAFVAAPILAWLLHRLYRQRAGTYKDWLQVFFWGLFTHPILDAFTTYGTQLFLPFSDYRVSFNNIFVADPLYTIPFLICVVICLFLTRTSPRRRLINYIGIGWSVAYMTFTLIGKNIANHQFEAALVEQNIDYQRYMTAPTILNSLLWYAVVEDESGYYMGYYSLLGGDTPIQFDYVERNETLLAGLENDHVVDRLKWFSNGYYVIQQKGDDLVFNDIKFGKYGFDGSPMHFVFKFRLWETENGEMDFKHFREMPDTGFGAIFDVLFRRIKGEVTDFKFEVKPFEL
ncbi:MAG: metal-dependent hydrolase [Chitinophagales bacterium]